MGIIIDIVIVAILILSVFIGYKQGLVKVIFNVCALLVAIIAGVSGYFIYKNIEENKTVGADWADEYYEYIEDIRQQSEELRNDFRITRRYAKCNNTIF